MATLLQTLLMETLPAATDPILRSYIETVLPALEREFALATALGGSQEVHYQILSQLGDAYAQNKAQVWSSNPDQSLMVHVLNALLTAWNLTPYLSQSLSLSETEKRLLCLGITLHDYDKHCRSQCQQPPSALDVPAILQLCRELGKKLNFQGFWSDWQEYLPEIAFLAQNTQFKHGTNPTPANWPQFKIHDPRRLRLPVRHLLGFGDIAVHLQDPADIVTQTGGDRLREHLRFLGIQKKLVYHRLRDSLGILTNGIHNATVHFARELGWQPILFFAQGVVYLAPLDSETQLHSKIVVGTDAETRRRGDAEKMNVLPLNATGYETPDCAALQEFIWQQITQLLGSKMLGGDIGFKRDGKGLKIAPQTLELFAPADLIRQLPNVIEARVANVKSPATPKRLQKLSLSESEREFLNQGADIRADRIAEYLIITQKEFFSPRACLQSQKSDVGAKHLGDNSSVKPKLYNPNALPSDSLKTHPSSEYINWVLEALELQSKISPEQTQVQAGGVNYGWYQAAAHYVATHPSLTAQEVAEKLSELAENLATWAENSHLLPEHHSPTREIFYNYLTQYLEVAGWESQESAFQEELAAYTAAKTKAAKQPICSLSSGEFTSEDQLESVVLFKPQQYSNKNPLGGRQIKRGISKIWSLEMLLRQAIWSVPAGKLEQQQPIYLYIFPAYVYSPQTAAAIRLLVNDMKRTNLWEVRKHWLKAGMHHNGLQLLDWRKTDEPESGRYPGDRYGSQDLPFMATNYTTTRGKTLTDAWIEPAFLALALPLLLGVKVVATSSSVPIYHSDRDFTASVILDGPAGFWQLLNLPTTLRIQDFSKALERLLVVYSLHLDTRSNKRDARWQAFNGTVREVMTDVLNIFALANERLRKDKREATTEEIEQYWHYAQIWSAGEVGMQEKLKITQRLVQEYRKFYQVSMNDSSHAILLPLSKALEAILAVPENWDDEELIFQGAGQLQAALERQEVYKRPLIKDKSVPYETRQAQEFAAIHSFMTTCVKELFGVMCKSDRALLQENRNRIKSGAEFAYRWLALQERS